MADWAREGMGSTCLTIVISPLCNPPFSISGTVHFEVTAEDHAEAFSMAASSRASSSVDLVSSKRTSKTMTAAPSLPDARPFGHGEIAATFECRQVD